MFVIYLISRKNLEPQMFCIFFLNNCLISTKLFELKLAKPKNSFQPIFFLRNVFLCYIAKKLNILLQGVHTSAQINAATRSRREKRQWKAQVHVCSRRQ